MRKRDKKELIEVISDWAWLGIILAEGILIALAIALFFAISCLAFWGVSMLISNLQI